MIFFSIPLVVKNLRIKRNKESQNQKCLERKSEVRIVAAGKFIGQKHGIEMLNSNGDALI